MALFVITHHLISICHDLGAHGDQCDKCGNLLDSLEPEPKANGETEEQDVASRATSWLLNPRCKLDGATPEQTEDETSLPTLGCVERQDRGLV